MRLTLKYFIHALFLYVKFIICNSKFQNYLLSNRVLKIFSQTFLKISTANNYLYVRSAISCHLANLERELSLKNSEHLKFQFKEIISLLYLYHVYVSKLETVFIRFELLYTEEIHSILILYLKIISNYSLWYLRNCNG